MQESPYVESKHFIIYEEESVYGKHVLPFLVAHMPLVQDTMVVGPTSLARSDKRFVHSLYRRMDDLKLCAAAIRFFRFQSRICVALVLPTGVTDETNRLGLRVAVGVSVSSRLVEDHEFALSSYLSLIMDTLNRLLGLGLPFEGADALLNSIRDPENSADVFSKLSMLVDLTRLASRMLGPELGSRRKPPESIKSLRKKLGQKTPRYILCGADASYLDAVNILSATLGPAIWFRDRTIVEGIVEGDRSETECIRLLRMPEIVGAVREAKVFNSAGRKYLLVY